MPSEHLKSGHKRYFIAIIPPSPVYEEALALKNYFKEKYQSKAALNSPPHITLHAPFLWAEGDENELITSLVDFTKERNKFPVELTGFGAFPPRVIFISVKENRPLTLFQSLLQEFSKVTFNTVNAKPNERPFHPHLTLAFRDLKKENFVKAWKEFSVKNFSAAFTADRFALLKHDGKVWQPFHYFHF